MEIKWYVLYGVSKPVHKTETYRREFWVTVSNFPLKMQSLFKSAEGWCKFVNKSSSGCINWGYFSFSLALSDLGTCFSMPGSIHIYYTAKYFLWLCNENYLLYNPPLFSFSLYFITSLFSHETGFFNLSFYLILENIHTLSQNLISLIPPHPVSPSQNSVTCKLRFIFIRGHLHRMCWIESECNFWIVCLCTNLAFFHSNPLLSKWICKYSR